MPNPNLMTCLITGATDGIGLALAHYYRQQNMKLVLVGRRPWAEVPLADFSEADYCQVDLAQPHAAQAIVNCLAAQGISHLDMVIHNAGLGYVGPTDQQPSHSIDTLVNVNVWAPIALTHALLPYVQKSSRAKIVFISSVVSILPSPNYAVYSATKAALDGFARNLRVELKGQIAVQVIHPGATRTGMHAKAGLTREVMNWDRFPAAEQVAAQLAQAIASPRAEATVGFTNKLVRFAGQHFGGVLDTLMLRRSIK